MIIGSHTIFFVPTTGTASMTKVTDDSCLVDGKTACAFDGGNIQGVREQATPNTVCSLRTKFLSIKLVIIQ